jgi:FHA domain
MVNPGALKKLAPMELAHDAMTLDLMGFVTLYGDAPLLLVRVDDGDEELELGLSATVPTTGTARSTIAEPLPFRTALQEAPGPPRASSKGGREEPETLRRLFERHTYFGVSVRKRGDSDALFMDRVSIGRARNKDIVLRHATISKFHAWFELSDADTMLVCDAGSTNLTYLNERHLEPRVRTAVEPGDVIRFGSVVTILTSATALWASFHSEGSSGLS